MDSSLDPWAKLLSSPICEKNTAMIQALVCHSLPEITAISVRVAPKLRHRDYIFKDLYLGHKQLLRREKTHTQFPLERAQLWYESISGKQEASKCTYKEEEKKRKWLPKGRYYYILEETGDLSLWKQLSQDQITCKRCTTFNSNQRAESSHTLPDPWNLLVWGRPKTYNRSVWAIFCVRQKYMSAKRGLWFYVAAPNNGECFKLLSLMQREKEKIKAIL